MLGIYLQGIYLVLLGYTQLSQCIDLRLYCDDITLRLYTDAPLFNSETLLQSNCYNSSRKNFIYAFGSFSTPESESTVTVLTQAVALKLYNVFLLNWEKEASALSTITPASLETYIKPISLVVSAIPHAFYVGTQLGEVLIRISKVGFNLENTYLVGHSLGAQIAGQAGRTVVGAGLMIKRIYGLDPSYHGIYGKYLPSLNAGDAQFVFCLHTDPGDYGTNYTLCDVDVMVNFKAFTQPEEKNQIQPDCPIGCFKKYTANDSCSHNRAWMLFAEGLRSPDSLIASKADNVWDWESGRGDCDDTVSVSIEREQRTCGVFFMDTNPTSPYGKGEAGSCP